MPLHMLKTVKTFASFHPTSNQSRKRFIVCKAAPQHTSSQQNVQQGCGQNSRRVFLKQQALLIAGLSAVLPTAPVFSAPFEPPQGYRKHLDKLDGYSFVFPDFWAPVTTSGNDVFYRNPLNIEENLFVNISSPSSSKFESVADLGTVEEAAERTKSQLLEEFMSTRLGVRREAETVYASSREGLDGKLYYDIEVRVRSYASRSQMAVSPNERSQELEFDRRLITTLGTAKGRLYELRIQTSSDQYDAQKDVISTIQQSFRCK
uniref:Lumenal-like protein n=1 Tax=Tetraselmis sp. GSL018 TaxID=582737 RepID=A0A061SP80_9CHLO